MHSLTFNHLLFFCFFLGVGACGPNPPKTVATEKKIIRKTNPEYLRFFSELDSTKAGQSLGCASSCYKLINDQYVLKIDIEPGQMESYKHITLDSSNRLTFFAELFIFDKKDAVLSPFCSDIVLVNGPRPSRSIQQVESGELIIAYSDPHESYIDPVYLITILVKRMTFKDPETGQKIEIKNELFWKVKDLGTPG